MLLLLVMATPSQAAQQEVPFGIRVYDIGPAPDFKLNDTEGETFKLSGYRGKWVFLHFWASWCGPCRREMPEIQKLSETIDDDQFAIVMINTSEDEDTIFMYLGEIQFGLNTLMDADGQVTEVWKPRGLPTTFLIDPDGNVRYQAIGGRDWTRPEYIAFINKLTDTVQ